MLYSVSVLTENLPKALNFKLEEHCAKSLALNHCDSFHNLRNNKFLPNNVQVCSKKPAKALSRKQGTSGKLAVLTYIGEWSRGRFMYSHQWQFCQPMGYFCMLRGA